MKSRMKKLLAAALALCLIAAMVPGAALAADTGNFSTPTKGKPETKTYHATLAEAIAYVGGFTSAENKVVTVEANSVEISSNISDRNVKLVVPECSIGGGYSAEFLDGYKRERQSKVLLCYP